MCTLTYLCNESGYELLFNRDEQRSRSLASPPKLDTSLGAIYPVDTQANGTWLAVSQSGLSLAILNYYQADQALFAANNNHLKEDDFTSRGELILSLLADPGSVMRSILRYDLSRYRPFVLVLFPPDLTNHNSQVSVLAWDGAQLNSANPVLPITSSSVDINGVIASRKQTFSRLVNKRHPNLSQLKRFHYSKQTLGHRSVNMSRTDAHTVSISHLCVDDKNVQFRYFDNVAKISHCSVADRVALSA